MDLSKILNIVFRYLWLLVLAALVAGVTTFFLLSRRPVAYRASTDLLVGPGLNSPSPDLNALRIGGQLVQTYAEVVDTQSFLESVNSKLDHKVANLNDLRDAISTRQSADTRVLTIIAYYPNPNQAVAIANAAAQTLLEMSPSKENTAALLRAQMGDQSHQLEQIVADSQASIAKLEAELATLRDTNADVQQQDIVLNQLTEERNRLSDALRTLASIYQILLDTNTNQVEILQPAMTAILVDQQIWIKVFSSALGGLIFALVLVLVADYFDDRLRFPGDLSRAAGVPLLGTIDRHPRLKGPGLERLVTFAQPESDAANGYREAVTKLLFTIGRSIPYTLLVSSVGSKFGDDAAVAAGNLAVAFAQAGYKVSLVDAQVDHSILTTIFKGERKEGLADLVLMKSSELPLLPVEQVPGIQFLPAGSSSDQSSHAMLNSIRVSTVFERLQQEADIVLVAGSAISRFAESLALASQVNGVVFVARATEARSKVVQKVVENLRLMKINLAGVIFDNNPSPFSSREYRKAASATERVAKEALQTTEG